MNLRQKTASLADHSLVLQLLNHLVDGVPESLLVQYYHVHCCGHDWNLLFTPQQSHSRRAQSVL